VWTGGTTWAPKCRMSRFVGWNPFQPNHGSRRWTTFQDTSRVGGKTRMRFVRTAHQKIIFQKNFVSTSQREVVKSSIFLKASGPDLWERGKPGTEHPRGTRRRPIGISAGPPELGPMAQTGVRDRHGSLSALWRPLDDHRCP